MSSEFSKSNVVLIVDDNPTNLAVLSDVLDHAGLQVLVAQDGESALQKAFYEPPDLILLDVMMPGIDGFETCRQLQAHPSTREIPVIFMTALSDITNKVKGFQLGAVDYIAKPFEQEEVLIRVEHHLKVCRLTKQLQAQNVLLDRITHELEDRVTERTSQLTETLEQLKQSQVSLVQTEKMAALGELVAGVAHEINNPLGCIVGNLTHMSEYTDDVLNLLQLYRQHFPEPVDVIKQATEAIDLEYLTEDLPHMVHSMKTSADRIKQIVHSLRHFSRRDEAQAQAVDLHEGIDSTLMILQHRLKVDGDRPAIQIIKEYGKLPPVTCYPGPLNQVFMNILANAIDALEEAEDTPPRSSPAICIQTELTVFNQVVIRIIDNGLGMTHEVKQRLLEPMFTTKSVSKGTGLGLSISRQIVEERHGGRLQCFSEPGQGAEFWIEIPLNVTAPTHAQIA